MPKLDPWHTNEAICFGTILVRNIIPDLAIAIIPKLDPWHTDVALRIDAILVH